MISTVFERLMGEYALHRVEAFAQNPFADYIRNEIPSVFAQKECVRENRMKVVASPGKGGWANVPWVAIMNPMETTSPQEGIYIVYLLSVDGRSIYLTLEQGATKFCQKIGNGGKKALHALERYVSAIKRIMGNGNAFPNGPIRLHYHGAAPYPYLYEAGVIFYKKYMVNNVPEEHVLEDDLKSMINLYASVLEKRNAKFGREVRFDL